MENTRQNRLQGQENEDPLTGHPFYHVLIVRRESVSIQKCVLLVTITALESLLLKVVFIPVFNIFLNPICVNSLLTILCPPLLMQV